MYNNSGKVSRTMPGVACLAWYWWLTSEELQTWSPVIDLQVAADDIIHCKTKQDVSRFTSMGGRFRLYELYICFTHYFDTFSGNLTGAFS